MPLIDKSYFVGDLNIPNTGNAAIGERLDWFIRKYEPEFLLTVMGYELYKSYLADASVERFTDIINGKEITVSDQLLKWPGLIIETLAPVVGPPAVAGQYKSIIANYVYYWWNRYDDTPKADDAEKQFYDNEKRNQRMAKAWNEMADGVRQLAYFLNNSTETYPEWINFNWYWIPAGASYNLYNLIKPINTMNL